MGEGTDQIIAADSEENTEQLRADIEDTRTEMTQTINEIQERLSPEHLMDQVKETVREATIGKVEKVMERVGETISGVTEPALEVAGRAGTAIKEAGSSVADSVWKNPIPVALIGLGVGLLLTRNFRSSSSRRLSQGRVPNYGMNNEGQGNGALDTVRETASNLANHSTDALSDLGTKAKNTASSMGTRFERVLHDNPLAIGAIAVAAGTAVGLMIPATRLESEYIGETGEMLVDKAGDVARGALDKVQDAARQMVSEGQQSPA